MKVLKHFYAKEYIGKYPSDKNVLINKSLKLPFHYLV